MPRWLVILLVIGVVAAGGWWYYDNDQQRQQAESAAQQAAALAETEGQEQVIWASGKLQPVVWAGLAPAASGVVAAVNVKEGDIVAAGDLLLELDTVVAASQVKAAGAALAEAQAALDKLRAGATPAEIAAAEAAVEAAKAQVALAASQMTEIESAVATANAQVRQAQAHYAEVASHPTAVEKLIARAAVAQAEAAVANAQAGYNLAKGDPEIGARPEALALSQATAGLEAANAQAGVSVLGPTQEQLAVAAAAIELARTQVSAAAQQRSGAEANVRAALAQVASAQAALDRLLAGATPEEIAMAAARVKSAQAAVESALAQLRLGQILAPFAGQVGAVNVHVGETIDPGAYAILLGDTGQLRVETTDLRETDVVRVAVGQPVEVTFDALPNRIFQGAVTHVAPMSSAEKGSTNYTVHVTVTDLDPSLRWGMTAFVNIQPQE